MEKDRESKNRVYVFLGFTIYWPLQYSLNLELHAKRWIIQKLGIHVFLFCDISSPPVLMQPRASIYIVIYIYIYNNSHFTAALLELRRWVFNAKS